MGQLVKHTHNNPFELTTSFFKGATIYRNRQVVANSFDGCKIVSIASAGGGSTSTDGFEIGEYRLFPYQVEKDNYLPAIGTSLNKDEYPALFAKIGYKYGGSGQNFNLPDVRNRVMQSVAASIDIGVISGSYTFDLIHDHNIGVVIDNHSYSSGGTVNVIIDEAITGGPITLSGSVSEDVQATTHSVSVTINPYTGVTSAISEGTTGTTLLEITGSDIQNHTDLISESVAHTHQVPTVKVEVQGALETPVEVAKFLTYTSTGHKVEINLGDMGPASTGLEHNFVGGSKDLSHSHDVSLEAEVNITHNHSGTGSVTINRTHSHTFSASTDNSQTHNHNVVGNFTGDAVELVHNVTVSEDSTPIPINVTQPTINVYCIIKVA